MMEANAASAQTRITTRIVIAGGGTSGWLAAAALSKVLGPRYPVTLIESDAIGRIGVGEATIPPIRTFHRLLGINEAEFMASTQATLKLGIEFQNWGARGDSYIHSFGTNGKDCWACDFTHFWLAGRKKGLHQDIIGEYCRELVAAREGRAHAGDGKPINYAYHLDAGRYADFLKQLALRYQTRHIEGVIDDVVINPENGNIRSLVLNDGQIIEGDIFLDCTGFAARLIHKALNVGYESYQHVLPCNAAVAVQSENQGAPKPYTQSIAHEYGWQWRIPLQHRSGNGLVYCSRYVSQDEATQRLLDNIDGPLIGEPRAFSYDTGRRVKAWHKNCVAIGLSAGFLEPLESTSIHLAMSSVLRLLKLFPQQAILPAQVEEFNQQCQVEMERVRNFIILHYHATNRNDSAFWRYCQQMQIPEELAHRIAIFRQGGIIPLQERELFQTDSWSQVMLGQHIEPETYHPIVDAMNDKDLEQFLVMLKRQVRREVDAIPMHQDFLNQYCQATRLR